MSYSSIECRNDITIYRVLPIVKPLGPRVGSPIGVARTTHESAVDVTLAEPVVEAFHPADDATAAALHAP